MSQLCELSDDAKSTNTENKENDHSDGRAAEENGALACYEDGAVGQCYISHVIDESQSLCLIIDVNKIPDTKSFFTNRIRPLNRLPRIGEMFAFNFDRQFMVRARRIDEPSTSNNSYCAYFIDIGCTVWIDMNDIEYLFEMDEMVKQMPSCAIKCKVIKMPSDRSLLTSLHIKMNFRIEKMGNNLIYIELSSDERNPFEPSLLVSDQGFYSYFKWDWNEPSTNEPNTDFQNNYQVNLEHFDGVQVFAKRKTRRNLISEILAEKYNRQNERTKLSDELSGKWKAHSDRMEEFADSLTFDDPVKISFSSSKLFPIPFLPKIGDLIKVKTFFIRDVERFYAFIPTCYNKHVMTPEQLTSAMNIQENRNGFVKCKRVPKINEYIFATHFGQVYRARVIRHYDSNYFQVFFIDFGNCSKVRLADGIYNWDARWNDVPPLAIACILNGVKKLSEFDFHSISAIEAILLNRTLEAEVVGVNESTDNISIVLNVKDKDNEDVASFLVSKGFSN